jgi:predicted component of type VI protein secretion system
MSLVIKEKKYELLTEGIHNVTITKVEDLGVVDTLYGAKDKARIYFTAQDQKDKEGNPVDTIMSVNKVLGAKSTLSKLLTNLGVNSGAEFDLNDLVGIKAQVVIEHKENDGRTFANIVSVLKNRKPAQEV